MATATRRRPRPTPRRPVRACIGGVVCITLVAAIVAFAADRWFYAIFLYSFLIGMTGGLMAWMVLEELRSDLQGTPTMAAAGLVTGAATYLLYQYLRYRFATVELDARPGWWEHLRATAEDGAAFGRVGRSSSVSLGASVVWAVRVLELGISMVVGGSIAKLVAHRR